MAEFRFRPHVVPLPSLAPEPSAAHAPCSEHSAREDVSWQAFQRLAHRPGAVFLDSSGGAPARFDLLAFDPLPAEPNHDRAFWSEHGVGGLRALLSRLEADGGEALPRGCPFAGGFLGALAYELGPPEERLELPPDPWSVAASIEPGGGAVAATPAVLGGLYVDYLVVDRRAGESYLVLGEEPGDGRAPWRARRDELVDLLEAPLPRRRLRATEALQRHATAREHRERVEGARAEIAQGEIYQANVVQRFSRLVEGDPLALYERLREAHPAPYTGFVRQGPHAVLSGSMELLLEVDEDAHGRFARTRPIKGTIGRGRDAREDEERARALLASEKDLAELGMIVDLERNDLGRVSRPGSVRVEGFPTLESYATVHHLMADVRARPRDAVDALELLRSLFPGGSITGAPKLRAMEILAALEGEGRGFSFGSLGFLDLRGRCVFNLLIRTLLWRARPDRGEAAGEVTYRVGGGITWASDAALEERESLLKGEALAEALQR